MMQLILHSSTMISSLIFIHMNHPLAMELMLLIHTLQTKTFWFSYVLFLIFLGGMLVLFIYVTFLASNEMFSLSMKMTSMCMLIFILLLSMSLFIDKSYTSYFIQNNKMKILFNVNMFTEENSLNLYKLYNYPTNLITILLMNCLLITLAVVVKITELFYGPLRLMN